MDERPLDNSVDNSAGESEASGPESRDGHRLRPGSFMDHYQVIRPLGAGGMAEVYLARDTRLGRKVAIKMIRPERLRHKKTVERFLFEARATAKFNHPNIVTVHAVGEVEQGPYLALEYLEGDTLRERLKCERISEKEAARIALEICSALVEAHKAGVIHRDLKPENVMLSRDGTVRVLDFGLSKILQEDSGLPDTEGNPDGEQSGDMVEPFVSHSDSLKGTPNYMSPEQWRQEEIGKETDIWSLGLIFFEMLTGRHPFQDVRSRKVLIAKVCSEQPIPTVHNYGQFSAEISDLVHRCLCKSRLHRPSSGEVCRDLEAFLGGMDRKRAVEAPFRGLLPFHERHTDLYFGRETEVSAFVERLREQQVMIVVGPSGAGKSSFVRAGVIPRLRAKGPQVVIAMRPGREPFRVLATKLLQEWNKAEGSASRERLTGKLSIDREESNSVLGYEESSMLRLQARLQDTPGLASIWLQKLAEKYMANVLLFVDQLEEICSLEDARTAESFAEAIACASDDVTSPVRVIATVREEFLSRLLTGNRKVQEALGRITVLSHPSVDTLRKMFTKPLDAAGYAFEDIFLISDMIEEVSKEPACLSLLQFAAQKLWEDRDEKRRVLRRVVFENMGGVSGALAQHADGVISGMSDREALVARTILLRLVTSEGARRVVRGPELLLGLGDQALGTLERLVEARLIVARNSDSRGGEFDLVHESLITAWGRLAKWLEESREERKYLHELSLAAELWVKKGRRDEHLLSAGDLREFKQRFTEAVELPVDLKELVNASLKGRARSNLRRALLAVGTFLSMAFAFALVYVVASRPNANVCQGAEGELQGVWNGQARQSVRAAFLSSGRAYAEDTYRRVDEHLARWSKEWVEMHTEVCTATNIKKEQSEKVLDLRMGCLQRKLQSMRSLLSVFAEKPDGTVVDKAIEASLGLGSIGFCADVNALEEEVEPPEKPEDRRTLAELRSKLDEVRQRDILGKHREAEAILEKLAPGVASLAYPPMSAEVELVNARNKFKGGKYEEAEHRLREALQAGLRLNMRNLAQDAAMNLAWVVGYLQARPAEGLAYADMALGYSRGRGDGREAEVLNTRAIIYYTQGSYKEALELLQRVLAIKEKALAPDHLELARYLNNLALVYEANGLYLQAEELHKRTSAIEEKALGPGHPDVAASLHNLACVYSNEEKYAKAEELHKQALAAREKALGPDHPDVAQSLNNLALPCLKLGKVKEAEQYFGRALAIEEKVLSPDHPEISHSLIGLGGILLLQNKPALALPLLERGSRIREHSKAPPELRADADIYLAQALWLLQKDRSRARALAEQAIERFRAAGPGSEKRLREAEAWLAEHR